jgi:hypothetical protein
MNIPNYEEMAYAAVFFLASDIFIAIIVSYILIKQKSKKEKTDEKME